MADEQEQASGLTDREFFDLIYQQWSLTTKAGDSFWMPEVVTDEYTIREGNYLWDLFAVDEEQKKHFLGGFRNEVDADFITAIHGALPDMVRRLHMALDKADHLDEERDEQEGKIADLTQEAITLVQERNMLTAEVRRLNDELSDLYVEMGK